MVWTPDKVSACGVPFRPDITLLRAQIAAQLSHIVLDAPDVPTLYFRRTVAELANAGVRILHYFNTLDEAIEARVCLTLDKDASRETRGALLYSSLQVSRLRRGLEKPYPGSAAILVRMPNVQVRSASRFCIVDFA